MADEAAEQVTGASPDEVARYERRRRLRLVGWCSAAVIVTAIGLAVARNPDLLGSATGDVVAATATRFWSGWTGTIFNPWYVGLVLLLILLETRFAAEKGAGTLSVGGAADLVWLVAYPVFSVTIVALWLGALDAVYDDDLGGVVFDLPEAVGLVAAMVIVFVVGDFLNWFTHWVRHKVPTFWYFHAVHHSQPQMGVLTDFRVHFMEPVIAATLVFIPSRLLGLEGEAAVVLAFSTLYFTAFTHANLRTNLGPLRWILVTPQFHRVHHGYAPEHIDKNFATALSIWDRLFRTAYTADEDEYCRTGIGDPDFPLPADASIPQVTGSYLRQQVYPFQQFVADVRDYELGRGRPVPADEPA